MPSPRRGRKRPQGRRIVDPPAPDPRVFRDASALRSRPPAALVAPALGLDEAADLLGLSCGMLLACSRARRVLAVPCGRGYRFPMWQFSPDQPSGTVPGLAAVLDALDAPSLLAAQWLRRAHPALGGASPAEALRAGRLSCVLEAARRFDAS